MAIKLLDCTLRDGGYVNNWNFGKHNIKNIVNNLVLSGVDAIELGFLDNRVENDCNRTFLSNMATFNDLLEDIDMKNTKLFAMIDYGSFDIEDIIDKKNCILDGIRVIFRKDKMKDAIEFCNGLSNMGYDVFVNPMNITNYNDDDLYELFDYVNKTDIFGVTIVDTYGLLTPITSLNLYKKFDKNLKKEFAIGFHVHNTLQLAMGNCFEIINSANKDRMTYIDGSLGGIGKGEGNAYTEILMKFFGNKYNLNYVVDLLDYEIRKIKEEFLSDYSLCRFISSINDVYYKYTDYYKRVKQLDFSEILFIESIISDVDKYNFTQEKAEMYFNKYRNFNNKYDAVIFDVDGTILDTTEGILSAIDYTIKEANLDDIEYNNKLYFIGPPIQDSFKNAYNLTVEDADKVANIFRDRYKSNDLYKAKLYEGIENLLKELKKNNIKVGIATYKREDYALRLLKHFGVSEYCDSIHGSDYEGKLSKFDIIKIVIDELKVNDLEKIVMVGDCETDYEGAKANEINFIGVTYGFGFNSGESDLLLVKNVDELKKQII